MTMAFSHILVAAIFVIVGIWVGRQTSILSGFIKKGS
jgi:hypothetical protein